MGKSGHSEYLQCVIDIIKGTNQAQKGQSIALEKLLVLRNYISDHEIDAIYDLLYESHEKNQKVLNYIAKKYMIDKQSNQIPNLTRNNTEHFTSPQNQNPKINKKIEDDFLRNQKFPEHKQVYKNDNYARDEILPKSWTEAKYDKSYNNGSLGKLCSDYNNVVDNPPKKSDFTQCYNPVRFGTINAMERRRTPEILPIFQTTSDGDYYAIKNDGDSLYAVVPRFDIDFQDYYYSPGAMGSVFECPNYNYLYTYRKVKVDYPALFELDSSQNQWKPKQSGKLILGIEE
jgi:hypothetical protein